MAKLPNYYKIHADGFNIELEPIYEDLVPVVHGRVEVVGRIRIEGKWEDILRCGNCKTALDRKNSYCPNCGAHMKDGDGNVD